MKLTYLMVLRHTTTGLMYFCKTVQNPKKYKGSGTLWKRHLRAHGSDVERLFVLPFTDNDDISEFALFFSDFFDIVKHRKNGVKVWANLIPENGFDGGVAGLSGVGVTNYGNRHTPEAKKKMTLWGARNGMFGKTHTPEAIEKIKKNRVHLKGSENPAARKCKTPLGYFGTIKDAAKAHKVSEPTLRKRLQSSETTFNQYQYCTND